MSKDKGKSYCVVDHANKQGERKAKSPNRLKLARERYGRWVGADQRRHSTADDDGGD